MTADPFLGGATVEIDPTKATAAQIARLADGGITGSQQNQPKTEFVHRYAAPLQSGVAPQRQAPSVNRNMVIAGYKGKADAWLRTLREVLHVHGAQVDRAFYLALDPREAHRQAELMEAGSQAFSTFAIVPYRDALPDPTPIGLPAARNLHSFVGTVMETYRNVGPILIVLPFHMLMPGGFDFIERNYTHAQSTKGIHFLGYEVKRPDGKRPGSAIVLPPLWARHPDFPLAKGLSQYTADDIGYIKDEVIRAMRSSDVMIGHGMKPGATTAIQTFAQDEIMDLVPPAPAFNPNGRPSVPSQPLPQAPAQQFAAPSQIVEIANTPPAPATTGYIAPAGPATLAFSDAEKAAALVLISQLGISAVKTMDAARYGVTLACDPEFADQAQNKAQGFKIRAGKAAKAK